MRGYAFAQRVRQGKMQTIPAGVDKAEHRRVGPILANRARVKLAEAETKRVGRVIPRGGAAFGCLASRGRDCSDLDLGRQVEATALGGPFGRHAFRPDLARPADRSRLRDAPRAFP